MSQRASISLSEPRRWKAAPKATSSTSSICNRSARYPASWLDAARSRSRRPAFPPRQKQLRRSGRIKRLPPSRSPPATLRKPLQKPSNVNVPVPYQPPCSHRRPAGDIRRRQRLLLDRPAVADRRTAETGGDRNPDGAARLQAGADADAETGNGVLQRQFAVAQRLQSVLQGPARPARRRFSHGNRKYTRQGDF